MKLIAPAVAGGLEAHHFCADKQLEEYLRLLQLP